MKWESKKPKSGDWRTVTKFAWIPVTTTLPDDKTCIWLERYEVNEQYRRSLSGVYMWTPVQIAPKGYWKTVDK